MKRWQPKKEARNKRYEEEERLRKKEIERRLQVVTWEVGEGRPGADVPTMKVRARVSELHLLEMSHTTFEDYKRTVFEKYPMPERADA